MVVTLFDKLCETEPKGEGVRPYRVDTTLPAAVPLPGPLPRNFESTR